MAVGLGTGARDRRQTAGNVRIGWIRRRPERRVARMGTMRWPTDPSGLEALQQELAELRPQPWRTSAGVTTGGCFVCFGRGGEGLGAAGDRAWAAATVTAWRRLLASAQIVGEAGAPYGPGLLAAREGALLEAAVRALPRLPDVLLVNATGRDHPRQAGLALQLGWALDVPTVGVTNRPLVASGDHPASRAGSRAPLRIDGEQVGWWLRTRTRARPVVVSPGWRTGLDTVLEVVKMAGALARTPEPIRQARRLARSARSRDRAADH